MSGAPKSGAPLLSLTQGDMKTWGLLIAVVLGGNAGVDVLGGLLGRNTVELEKKVAALEDAIAAQGKKQDASLQAVKDELKADIKSVDDTVKAVGLYGRVEAVERAIKASRRPPTRTRAGSAQEEAPP